MNRLFVLRNHNRNYVAGYAFSLCGHCCCASASVALAQSPGAPVNTSAPFSIRATHLLGLQNTKNNCNGTLSIQNNALQFQPDGKPERTGKHGFCPGSFFG